MSGRGRCCWRCTGLGCCSLPAHRPLPEKPPGSVVGRTSNAMQQRAYAGCDRQREQHSDQVESPSWDRLVACAHHPDRRRQRRQDRDPGEGRCCRPLSGPFAASRYAAAAARVEQVDNSGAACSDDTQRRAERHCQADRHPAPPAKAPWGARHRVAGGGCSGVGHGCHGARRGRCGNQGAALVGPLSSRYRSSHTKIVPVGSCSVTGFAARSWTQRF